MHIAKKEKRWVLDNTHKPLYQLPLPTSRFLFYMRLKKYFFIASVTFSQKHPRWLFIYTYVNKDFSKQPLSILKDFIIIIFLLARIWDTRYFHSNTFNRVNLYGPSGSQYHIIFQKL